MLPSYTFKNLSKAKHVATLIIHNYFEKPTCCWAPPNSHNGASAIPPALITCLLIQFVLYAVRDEINAAYKWAPTPTWNKFSGSFMEENQPNPQLSLSHLQCCEHFTKVSKLLFLSCNSPISLMTCQSNIKGNTQERLEIHIWTFWTTQHLHPEVKKITCSLKHHMEAINGN